MAAVSPLRLFGGPLRLNCVDEGRGSVDGELEFGVGGVGGGEAAAEVEGFAGVVEGFGVATEAEEAFGGGFVRERQIAAGSCILGFGGGQGFVDGDGFAGVLEGVVDSWSFCRGAATYLYMRRRCG